MKKEYIDLHCHPFIEYFDNPKEIIKDSYQAGLKKMFLVGTNIDNSKEAIELANNFSYAYSAIGIHPTEAYNKKDLNKIESFLKDNNKVVAIGEVGLDYHYSDSPSKEQQIYFFKKQIELALKYQLALIVHSRDAAEDTYQIIKKYAKQSRNLKIILHTYAYDLEYLEKFNKLGCYFSYSGIVTFKNAIQMQECALQTPLNRIFYETDTPYLTPTPFRGKTNYPKYAIYVANFIAKLKNIDINLFLKAVNKNVSTVFGDKVNE